LHIENSKGEKKSLLTRVEKQFTKIGGAVMRHTTLNVGANIGGKAGTESNKVEAGAGIGAEIDFGKFWDDYKSDGSFIHGQERIYFHKHITDHLEEELQKIRGQSRYNDFKIVIFVDDLDRCTPDRALELLESIKSFFDIEGIIYVIGIDPTSIDPIIKTKYDENSKIDGMHYLQKIVQLPFQIPVWNAEDLSNAIRNMISKTGIPKSVINEILDKTNTELIINAAQPNPRDIKRFINSIILSRYIYEQSIKDIEKIVAVQAFYFRGGGWLEFLKLLFPYKNRIEFLKDFILLNEKESSGRQGLTLEDLKKIRVGYEDQEKKSTSLDKPILEIYKKLVELGDEDLLIFLRKSAPTLIKIERIEKYLRVVEETTLANKRKSVDVDSEEQLKLIRDGKIKDFNVLQRMRLISLTHLPYEDFSDTSLNGIELHDAFLFKVFLSENDLSDANLIGADLSNAYLSDAKLLGADLSDADLSGAILVHNKYDQSINKNTNFNNAVIDNPNYIKYLHSSGGQNIPDEIKNMSELRSLLEKSNLDEHLVNRTLGISDRRLRPS
jgi:hypothetical protein